MHIGDEILSIDRTTLEYTSLAEVYQLLKNAGSPNGRVKLEILPIKTAYANEMKNFSVSNSNSVGAINSLARSKYFLSKFILNIYEVMSRV